MPKDWNPSAPPVKRDFNRAARFTPPTPSPTRSTPAPASVIELKKLQAERKPPAPQMKLTMRGPIPHAARSHANQNRETRIAEIKQQLAQRRNQARDGFKRAR